MSALFLRTEANLMIKISLLCEIAINVQDGKFQESKHDSVLNIKFTWRNL